MNKRAIRAHPLNWTNFQEKAPACSALIAFSGCLAHQAGWVRSQNTLCCPEVRTQPTETPRLTHQDLIRHSHDLIRLQTEEKTL